MPTIGTPRSLAALRWSPARIAEPAGVLRQHLAERRTRARSRRSRAGASGSVSYQLGPFRRASRRASALAQARAEGVVAGELRRAARAPPRRASPRGCPRPRQPGRVDLAEHGGDLARPTSRRGCGRGGRAARGSSGRRDAVEGLAAGGVMSSLPGGECRRRAAPRVATAGRRRPTRTAATASVQAIADDWTPRQRG